MQIFLGSDHAAYGAKKELAKLLASDHEVEDLGSDSEERVNYPDFATEVCRRVNHGEDARGILLCGSGIGMSMVANRYRGIRAALCHTVEDARLSRQHNDANVLCLGARTTDRALLLEIARVWLETDFEEGRHCERIHLFDQLGEAF